MALTYATVTTAAELAQDILDLSGATGSFTLTIGADFTFDRQIGPLSMGAGGTLAIVGAGHTLSGAGSYQGLFVATGTVSIDSLTLANMKAQGGAGGTAHYAGGGGMGAGGALFVGSSADVTLTDVSFSSNQARGGAGGTSTGGIGTATGGSLSGSGSLGGYGAGGFGGGGNANASGGFGGGGGAYRSGGFGAGSSGFYSGGGGLGAGGAVFVRQGGTLSLGAGTLSGGSVAGGAGGGFAATAGSAYGSGLFIQGNATVTLAAGSGTLTVSDVIADQSGSGGSGGNAGLGVLSLASGTAHLTAANTFKGGVSVAAGATLELGATAAAGTGTITLAGDGAALLLDSGVTIANTLAALSHLDSITLAGLTGSSVAVSGSALQVVTTTGTVSFALDSAAYQTSDFTLSQNGADAVVAYTACYAEGTRIATPAGATPVERLQPGDPVRTADGRTRPVRWLGWRRIDCRRHPSPPDILPVRIRQGAIAPGLPVRDLVVSPDHALFLDGVLIPARYLLNGATIVQEPAGELTYYHVELAAPDGAAVHDVILAENLPAESYLDTGNRPAFANGGPAPMLHPDFAASHALAIWHDRACASLVVEGETLAAVRHRLLRRAAALGWRQGLPAAPVLDIDGRTIEPIDAADCLLYPLPPGATHAVLRSPAFVPAQNAPGNHDQRRLGVAVQALALDGIDRTLDTLQDGWHPPEAGWRWTDGAALIPLDGASDLTLRLAPIGVVWRLAA